MLFTCPSGLPHRFEDGECGYCGQAEGDAMTPMKTILVFGNMILVEDMAGGIELKATCPNERDADWLASSLGEYHHVPVERLETKGSRVATSVLRVTVAK